MRCKNQNVGYVTWPAVRRSASERMPFSNSTEFLITSCSHKNFMISNGSRVAVLTHKHTLHYTVTVYWNKYEVRYTISLRGAGGNYSGYDQTLPWEEEVPVQILPPLASLSSPYFSLRVYLLIDCVINNCVVFSPFMYVHRQIPSVVSGMYPAILLSGVYLSSVVFLIYWCCCDWCQVSCFWSQLFLK